MLVQETWLDPIFSTLFLFSPPLSLFLTSLSLSLSQVLFHFINWEDTVQRLQSHQDITSETRHSPNQLSLQVAPSCLACLVLIERKDPFHLPFIFFSCFWYIYILLQVNFAPAIISLSVVCHLNYFLKRKTIKIYIYIY